MIYFTSMTLGEYITIELEQRGWDIAKFARELKVSWQRAQRLAFDEPKRVDGSPPTVRPETIEKVAKVFKDDPKTILDKIYLVDKGSGENSVKQIGTPSLQALYEGLPPDDKNELIEIALLKWRKNHPNETPPQSKQGSSSAQEESSEDMTDRTQKSLETAPETEETENAFALPFPGIKISAYTDEIAGPFGPLSEADNEPVCKLLLQILAHRVRNIREISTEEGLRHTLRKLLGLPELDDGNPNPAKNRVSI